MCTVNWWQIELKKDNKIKIIGNCEWFFKLIKGIPLFQSVSDSIADIFYQRTSPLPPPKPQYNQISTLWTSNWWESYPKNDNIIKILGSGELF